ncbi:sialate O-acetylesterase [Pseudooceanicola atlanticus]|uniref:sialate O-acetylesterase n=1 Tax=Pseudooceanicola atlanticus TaxID=1461694 RepID=UPI00235681AE|nr:sialate O-acetylesterase [Pseudooceanicola atlanticus]
MPFSSGTFTKLWDFVTQFSSSETADRSDFDLMYDDIRDSAQDAYDALDTRITTNATGIASNLSALSGKATDSDLASLVTKFGWKNRGTTEPWHQDYKIQIGSNWYSPDPILVVAGGQSNALGNSSSTGGDKTTNNNFYAWDWNAGAWVLAELGSVPFKIAAGNPNSFTFHACKNLSDDLEAPILLIQRPVAGSAIGTWRASLSGANWTQLETDIAAAIAAGSDYLYTKTKADFFLWHQGEDEFNYDPHWQLTQNIYPEFIEQVFGASWAAADMRMVAGEMLREEDGGIRFQASEAWRRVVSSGAYSRLGLWASTNLTDIGDGIHFDGASLVKAGRRAADVGIDLGSGIKSPTLDVDSDSEYMRLINEKPYRLIAEIFFNDSSTYNQTVSVPVERTGVVVVFEEDGTDTQVTSGASNASFTVDGASNTVLKVWFPSEIMSDEPPGLTCSNTAGQGTIRHIRFGQRADMKSIFLSGHDQLDSVIGKEILGQNLDTLKIINCPLATIAMRGSDLPNAMTDISFSGTPVPEELAAEIAAENTARGNTITSITAGFSVGYRKVFSFQSITDFTTAVSGGLEAPDGTPALVYDDTLDRYWMTIAKSGESAISGVSPAGWKPVNYDREIRETATNIADSSATINTTDKYAGKRVWDTTNARELRASGSNATDDWDVVDGSASVTPS